MVRSGEIRQGLPWSGGVVFGPLDSGTVRSDNLWSGVERGESPVRFGWVFSGSLGCASVGYAVTGSGCVRYGMFGFVEPGWCKAVYGRVGYGPQGRCGELGLAAVRSGVTV